MESGIERTPTAEEKTEYRQVGSKTPKDIFLKQLAEVEAEFTKAHKPFDSQCARVDFVDELDRITKESERIYGYVRQEDISQLKFKNLKKYGDMDRFEVLGEDVDMGVIDKFSTMQVPIGKTIKYKCKARGHGISVFIPKHVMDSLEEEKAKSNK